MWNGAAFNAAKHGSTLLKNILGDVGEFSFPKSIWTVWHSLEVARLQGDDLCARLFRPVPVPQAALSSGSTAKTAHGSSIHRGSRRSSISTRFYCRRIKKVTFTPDWKDGKPKRHATPEDAERSAGIPKVMRLECLRRYRSTVWTARRTDGQKDLRRAPAHRADARTDSRSSTSCPTCSMSRRAAAIRCSTCTHLPRPRPTNSRF